MTGGTEIRLVLVLLLNQTAVFVAMTLILKIIFLSSPGTDLLLCDIRRGDVGHQSHCDRFVRLFRFLPSFTEQTLGSSTLKNETVSGVLGLTRDIPKRWLRAILLIRTAVIGDKKGSLIISWECLGQKSDYFLKAKGWMLLFVYGFVWWQWNSQHII